MLHLTANNEPSVSLPSIHALSSGMLSPQNEVLSWASVDFAQMIEAAGAESVVGAIGEHFKIGEARMRDIIRHASPFLLRAHRHWMDRPGGRELLDRLARSGGPQQFADRPALVSASVSEQEGRVFLGHLFLDEMVLALVAQRLASRLEMTSQKLEQMMPHLAALFVGCLCKSLTP